MKIIRPSEIGFTVEGVDLVQQLKDFWNESPGECVICGGPTKTKLNNWRTRKADYVHDGWETDDRVALACKQVWRLRNRVGGGRTTEPDDPRNTWHDYESYIASYEWEIKATAAKRLAKWRCVECNFKGNKTTLHAHHKHYRTLYQERPEDIDVLCVPCHETEHGL